MKPPLNAVNAVVNFYSKMTTRFSHIKHAWNQVNFDNKRKKLTMPQFRKRE